MLFRRIKSANKQESSLQVIVPESWRKTILKGCHDGSGHMGLKKTLAKVRMRYFWPGMYHDVEDWCN